MGTKDTLPLDFRNFPELHGDISAIQKEVVGNPMYDPAGMLVALAGMGASAKQIAFMVQKLQNGESLIAPELRTAAMKGAYGGQGQEMLAEKFFPSSEQARRFFFGDSVMTREETVLKTPTAPYSRDLEPFMFADLLRRALHYGCGRRGRQ